MERAYIHIAGPSRAGKTTLIERLLEFSPSSLLVVRCSASGDVKDYVETREKNDEELARYLKAGAEGVARYRFEPGLERTDAFWETELMEEPSDAVLFEGDLAIEGADLAVYVTRPLPARRTLVRRVLVDKTQVHERNLKWLESLLERPDTAEEFFFSMFGNSAIGSQLGEEARAKLRSTIEEGLEKARAQGPPPPEEGWAVAKGIEGIELAQAVAINVTSTKERKRGEAMRVELQDLREDKEVFYAVAGPRGKRTPIMARVVDLSDPEDKNLKSLLRRIQRTINYVRSRG